MPYENLRAVHLSDMADELERDYGQAHHSPTTVTEVIADLRRRAAKVQAEDVEAEPMSMEIETALSVVRGHNSDAGQIAMAAEALADEIERLRKLEMMDQTKAIFEAWARGDDTSRLLNGLFEIAQAIDPQGMMDAFRRGRGK